MNLTGLNAHADMPAALEDLARIVVDSVFSVHKELGPGFLERIYEEALICEFQDRGIDYLRQYPVAVSYKGRILPCDYKIDLIVENNIILELKTVDRIAPIHEAQIISYMKQQGAPLGLIVNFNEALIKNGIKRVILSSNLRNFASSR